MRGMREDRELSHEEKGRKNSGKEKSRTRERARERALSLVLDFSSPEFFFSRLDFFPPSWVYEDGHCNVYVSNRKSNNRIFKVYVFR